MNRLFRTCKQQLGSFVYRCSDRVPGIRGRGYTAYRNSYIERLISNQDLLQLFQESRELPDEFGTGLDERVIEYPWLLSKLLGYEGECRFLDAGSTFNHQMILQHPLVKAHKWTLLTLAPERDCFSDEGVSYVFDDLRSMPFRDGLFDAVFSISVIEHVGMDNTSYTADRTFRESKPLDYLIAIAEIRRVLRPGGCLYLTVPFGRYEDHGWLQQFDAAMLSTLISHFEPQSVCKVFFRYTDRGWNLTTEDQCANLSYSDMGAGRFSKSRETKRSVRDLVVAASAVACVELRK
jgi:SAM-dependent methyltransferase